MLSHGVAGRALVGGVGVTRASCLALTGQVAARGSWLFSMGLNAGHTLRPLSLPKLQVSPPCLCVRRLQIPHLNLPLCEMGVLIAPALGNEA